MNRTIYDAAFNILTTQKEICNKLDCLGINFEYGQGFIGQILESLINDSETIVKECLGLDYYNPIEKMINVNGSKVPIVIERLYTHEHNVDWSITADDFCEFFYQAIGNEHLRDLMWKAIVEKDISAKIEFNNFHVGTIGTKELEPIDTAE